MKLSSVIIAVSQTILRIPAIVNRRIKVEGIRILANIGVKSVILTTIGKMNVLIVGQIGTESIKEVLTLGKALLTVRETDITTVVMEMFMEVQLQAIP